MKIFELPIELQLYIIKFCFINEDIELVNVIRLLNKKYKYLCDSNKHQILRSIIPINKNEQLIDALYMNHIVRNFLVDYSNIITKVNQKFIFNNIRYIIIDVSMDFLPLMPNVITLECSSIGLKKIAGLPQVKKLVCSNNYLEELPDMEHLEYLDYSFNPLKTLPYLPNIKKIIYFSNMEDSRGTNFTEERAI